MFCANGFAYAYRLSRHSYSAIWRHAGPGFDTHRLTLLTSLGYALPTSLEEERQVWQAVGQLLYRRDTDRPELLKYHD